ncbi:MAG TPA: heme-dependent oxidative N-demethylase subunit alpha family protein [Polyangiales bacterium]|nr:heme-dependent oxidative N-demethylase subunit alpha family protein [Polyangiales bacterium]
MRQASYFPIQSTPLKMVAGLRAFGVDLGQGAQDRRYFQRDGERARYLAAKRAVAPERHWLAGDDDEAVHARAAALAWLRETLAREDPEALAEADRDRVARDPFDAIARAVQEDFAVLCAGEQHDGRTVALDVRFPSGWRPERLAQASFHAIHVPVPGFADNTLAARSMVRAMIERGPYVRFVWTLCRDDVLDHHPERANAGSWDQVERLFLRVERQITVSLPEARTSVFLIRTYLYPYEQLDAGQRATLREALRVMPDDVRAYKGLPSIENVDALL